MRGPGTSKHCVLNMAADEEAAIAAVIAAIFLVNKEEEENREAFWICRIFWQSYIQRRGDTSLESRAMQRINVVPAYPLSVFKESFRLSWSTFETLTEMLAGCPEFLGGNERGGRPQVDVSKQLLITLWVLGNQESYRSVGERFNAAKSTVFNCLLRVCNALVNNDLSPRIDQVADRRASCWRHGRFWSYEGISWCDRSHRWLTHPYKGTTNMSWKLRQPKRLLLHHPASCLQWSNAVHRCICWLAR